MTDEPTADLVIIGGGLGGVAAAVTALRLGKRVILTEGSSWLGGQLTTQAVPPDEHPWVESELTSPSYRELRDRIRQFYRQHRPLTGAARQDPHLNPGGGFVSRLCHEPRIGAAVIAEMLRDSADGRLTLLHGCDPAAVERTDTQVTGVRVRDRASGAEQTLRGRFVVDATELGDLLPLAGVPYVVGAEARRETGELHAPEQADPLDQQAISWCFAVEYCTGEDHTIARPEGYEHWRDTHDPRWPGSQLSWTDVHPITLERRTRPIFGGDPQAAMGTDGRDLWHYRRIVSRQVLDPSYPGGEVTLVNWPQIDYWERPLLHVSSEERTAALRGARELGLSMLHWMQTEAPRADGGIGYPELRLRGDLLGTDDGLAMEPYIRESRRIRARFTVTEGHIGEQMRGRHAGSALFPDSVGIGYYRIDLHPSTSGRSYVDIGCFPFQIPLGALLPHSVDNLLPANKNIGTTHISNGAYRLHPVEWSIGEAVGALTAHCLEVGRTPTQVRENSGELRRFQRLLTDRLGLTLAWPEEIRTGRDRSA